MPADLPELAYDALDELRWCAVHPYNGHLLALVEDLKAICETLPRAQVLAVHGAEADPRRDLDLLFLQKLNQCLQEKGLSLNAGKFSSNLWFLNYHVSVRSHGALDL